MDRAAALVFVKFTILVSSILVLSFFVSSAFEKGPGERDFTVPDLSFISAGMKIGDIISRAGLDDNQAAAAFGSASREAALGEAGISAFDAAGAVRRVIAIKAESASKNWKKIFLKFALWIVFIAFVFKKIRSAELTAKNRFYVYLFSTLIFGVALGSDPGPMGTVKDAIVMYAADGAIFMPRLAAMLVFLGMVLVVNKSICAWGCQAGSLQDAVFRLNRNSRDTAGIICQIKIPFYISNSVRAAFFVAVVFVALHYGFDIVEPVDPFKVFKPSHIAASGAFFIAAVLMAGLFVYRPWCHLFCPFGLAGWIVERFSLYRIRVDENKCVSCGACLKACPSDAMDGILNKKKVRPDCFSCGVCVEICPVKAVSFK